jgi:hypothetical protein
MPEPPASAFANAGKLSAPSLDAAEIALECLGESGGRLVNSLLGDCHRVHRANRNKSRAESPNSQQPILRALRPLISSEIPRGLTDDKDRARSATLG